MNKEDYNKYYIQGSDHYLIPKDVFKELFNEMSNWKEEAKELKKQLEEKENIACSWKDSCLENAGKIEILENQQKEFIDYLESYLKLFDNKDTYEEGYYDCIEEILSKYKEIIGAPIAGLDDEEEPDLFEMIEDMKNKPKHIEEVKEIVTFQDLEVPYGHNESMFMKRIIMQQNKINEIIKTVNYLLDKEQNSESPAELN